LAPSRYHKPSKPVLSIRQSRCGGDRLAVRSGGGLLGKQETPQIGVPGTGRRRRWRVATGGAVDQTEKTRPFLKPGHFPELRMRGRAVGGGAALLRQGQERPKIGRPPPGGRADGSVSDGGGRQNRNLFPSSKTCHPELRRVKETGCRRARRFSKTRNDPKCVPRQEGGGVVGSLATGLVDKNRTGPLPQHVVILKIRVRDSCWTSHCMKSTFVKQSRIGGRMVRFNRPFFLIRV